MNFIRLRFFLLLPLLALATNSAADTQSNRAEEIETLSRSFYAPGTPAEQMQNPQHAVTLDQCRLSMIQMNRSRRTSLFSGVAFEADLTTTSLQPVTSGDMFDYMDTPNPFGILHFSTDSVAAMSVYDGLTTAPTPANIWAQVPSQIGEVSRWVFSIHSNPTKADMTVLVDALVTYKRDFCSPAS